MDNGCESLQLLDVKQAAGLLRVSVRTVRRMIAGGELSVVRFRHCTRLRELDLIGYVEKRRRTEQHD